MGCGGWDFDGESFPALQASKLLEKLVDLAQAQQGLVLLDSDCANVLHTVTESLGAGMMH